MKKLRCDLPNAQASDHLGQALAGLIQSAAAGKALVLFYGELGAGKSTVVRALLRVLGVQGPIPSPTYTLVEPYSVAGLNIRHLDLYRLSDASELDALGGRELFDGITLVEWPERAPLLRDIADLIIELEVAGEGRVARLGWSNSSVFAEQIGADGNLL